MTGRIKRRSGQVAIAASAAAVGLITVPVPVASAFPNDNSPLWQAALCVSDPTKCFRVWTSSNAAKADLNSRPPRVNNAWRDGSRDNAFLHASWNARAAVVTGDRGYVLAMSTLHEVPLTSSNPPGTNRVNRHEHVDLCNNKYGSNKPSNWDLITVNQMSSVNSLWSEAGALQENGAAPEALMPSDTCSGIRLYFIRKDNGVCFGVDPNLGPTWCKNL